MFQPKSILFYFLLFLTISCSSNKLSGSWEFIDIYDGEINRVDTLKKQNKQFKVRNWNPLLLSG
ncbi:hypothetical protein DDI74_04295 [Chryseobacterium gleum]|jgi:hypothetical protein|nr:hypothetical protein DDI74_04295 [Chryseobacterium gleum]